MSNTTNQIKTVTTVQRIALLLLLILSSVIFLFALVSGAETFGSGFSAIVQNSPNTLPWLGLLVLVWVARRNKATGGLLIGVFGLIITWFLNFRGQNFFLITFVICLSITFLGFLVWMCEQLIRAAKNQKDSK